MATTAPRLQFFGLKNVDQLPQMALVSREHLAAMKVVAHVLPFRVNNYVIQELINWNNVPDDPIFQLTFPQPGMLSPEHFAQMQQVLASGASHEVVQAKANEIREYLNPHPEGQMQYNVPKLDGDAVPGIQHKYRETCLVFPSAGQTCHAYCTFCFRWAQFVGMDGLKFATDEAMRFADYLGQHREITDVLFTGGDPMVMRTEVLARYIEPLLAPEYDHIRTIRIGTKSLSYWPYRYTTDKDSDELMRLLERVTASGKHLAIMAHFNHHQEMQTEALRHAVKRLQNAGAVIRTQSPLIRHINDDARVWSTMWQQQVHLGMVPYYMFIERETGAKPYFQLPLSRAVEIYRNAMNQVSGLARTARGPVMSALPGKVCVDGVAEIAGRRVYVLSFLQARDASWCKQPFFAEFNAEAHWLHDLKPAFGEKTFFYENELKQLLGRLGGEKPIAVPVPVPRELSLLGEPVAAA